MVDEQIVVSALQVEVCGESFLLVEEFLPVGQVTPDAHVGAACQGKSQIAHGSEQVVECSPFVQPAFAALVAAVAQHHLGAWREVACHQSQPLVALGHAVSVGKHHPVIFAGLDSKHHGQFLAADVAGGLGHEAVVEMGIFLFEDGQVVLALVGVVVVDDDDFKFGVVLLQHGAQVAAQIFRFLADADDDGYGWQFLGEMRVSLFHGTAACMDTVVETEVVDNLNKEQATRRSEYDNFSRI